MNSDLDDRDRSGWQAPQSDDPERRALPAHLKPAAAALFDGLPEPLADSVVQAALGRLEAGAAELAARVEPDAELIVDAFAVRTVAGCPAALAGPGEPFSWTPATAARTLGLRAVAYHLRGATPGARLNGCGGSPVEAAVEAVVADMVDGGGDRTPGPWLSELAAPARAVAVSHARRWAEQAVAWLPLRLVGPRELRFLDDDWWPPRSRAASRTLVIHGRRDITIEVAGRRVAVIVAGGMASGPGLAEVDALTALAAVACDPRSRQVRVVRIHPASGEVVATEVGAGLLTRGVEVVLATVSALAQVAAGAEPAAVPGPACTWCSRRDVCAEGAAWLARPDRRSMGLPLAGIPR